MIDGGALTVTLIHQNGAVNARLDAPQPLSWARMLAGKPAVEAARVAGLVADSCPAAHEAAARAAFGLPPREGEARRMALEALREHVFKFCVAWPRALGREPAPYDPEDDNLDTISRAAFGDGGAPEHIAGFERWMRDRATTAAQAMDHVWRRWDARWGRADLPLWRAGDPMDEIDWSEAEIDGSVAEIGVAARMADAHLMREIEARRGRGVAWRLAARLTDAARLIAALRGEAPLDAAMVLAPGVGAAQSATGVVLARGALTDGRVSSFDQLTPTDFALHPSGLLNRMLGSGPHALGAPAMRVAALTLEAVDPRLPTRLVIETEAPARARPRAMVAMLSAR